MRQNTYVGTIAPCIVKNLPCFILYAFLRIIQLFFNPTILCHIDNHIFRRAYSRLRRLRHN